MTQTTAETQVKAKAKGVGRWGAFLRAGRYVYPYRKLMVISIVAAFFVGATGTVGLTMLLPIMRVLLNEDTVAHYVDRSLAEKRLGVVLDENAKDVVRVIKVNPASPAEKAGIKAGDELNWAKSDTPDLARLADARVTPEQESLLVRGGADRTPRDAVVALRPGPWYAAPLRQLAGLLPTHPIKALAVMLSAVLGLAIVGNIFRYFQEYYSDRVAIYAIEDIRRRTYDHALHVPLGHFGKAGTSDITSRLVTDCANLREGFRLMLGQSVQAPITAGMALGLALWVDWRLTAFIVLFAPVMVAVIRKFGKKVRRASRSAMEKNSQMLAQLEATFTGLRVVKASRAERIERRRYAGIMGGLVNQQEKMSRAEALTTPTVETLTMMVVSGVVLFAAYLVLVDKSLEVASFFLIMACLVQMGESLRRIGKLNNLLQRANAAAERIFEVLDLPVERERALDQRGGRVKLPPLSGEIRFEEVSFTYPGAPAPALRGVSLAVPKGRVVAVVGRNGSGKTTLLALLPRFYDPQSGRITIDGVDIKDATLPSLRGQISLVTQDSQIFPMTVAQNIAYGHPHAHLLAEGATSPTARQLLAEVESAALKAFAHDFITAKPGGYHAMLDGLGGQLSGGQRQRLCIARAILRKAPILILDEATSQVDAQSEHLIQQAIDGLVKDAHAGGRTTTFIIAHRFSTILSADEIVVMDEGKLVARGTHTTLLETSSVYRQLYERQLMAPAG